MFVLKLRRLGSIILVSMATVGLFLLGQYSFRIYFPEAYQALSLARHRPLPVFRFATDRPVIYLTLNVSWGDAVALHAAEVLADQGVAATFFVTGPWARSHQEQLRAFAEAGHDIASLGSATVDYRDLNRDQIRQNMESAREALRELPGVLGTVFRPPLGKYSVDVLELAQALGYRVILWDVEPMDWKLANSDEIIERVVAAARPGSIIRFHADDSYPQLPELLPQLVTELRRAGFAVLPLRTAFGPK